MQCLLAKDINTCPFYEPDVEQCTNENTKCTFRIPEDNDKPKERNRYVREPRWYEKYYK